MCIEFVPETLLGFRLDTEDVESSSGWLPFSCWPRSAREEVGRGHSSAPLTARVRRTWSVDGTPRATLTGHTKQVVAVAIAPDGTWLATASPDTTARTWSVDSTPPATLIAST
jgi:WD40 repeat protein